MNVLNNAGGSPVPDAHYFANISGGIVIDVAIVEPEHKNQTSNRYNGLWVDCGTQLVGVGWIYKNGSFTDPNAPVLDTDTTPSLVPA
jgi:hypothetical protein